MATATELRKQIETALAGRIPAALSPRPLRSPELLSCGVAEVDALLGGGLPLGAIAELTGARSSGRTTLALSTLAALTRQGHCCAYVDACDSLDPHSAAAIGVDLRLLLWIRPAASKRGWPPGKHAPYRRTGAPFKPSFGLSGVAALSLPPAPLLRLEATLRATDLLLNTGGFRALVLDLGDLPPEQARRVPMASWHRFRLQAEKSRTLLLLISGAEAPQPEGAPHLPSSGRYGTAERATPCAQSCAAVCLHCHPASPEWHRAAPQSMPLLAGLHYRFSLERSQSAAPQAAPKKPAAACTSTHAACNAREAAWHGAISWTG
jgi:hypothetical protein